MKLYTLIQIAREIPTLPTYERNFELIEDVYARILESILREMSSLSPHWSMQTMEYKRWERHVATRCMLSGLSYEKYVDYVKTLVVCAELGLSIADTHKARMPKGMYHKEAKLLRGVK